MWPSTQTNLLKTLGLSSSSFQPDRIIPADPRRMCEVFTEEWKSARDDFNKAAKTACMQHDAKIWKETAAQLSTVRRYSKLIRRKGKGQQKSTAQLPKCRGYLRGPSSQGSNLLLQCRAGCLKLNALTATWASTRHQAITGANCGCCDASPPESTEHFILICPRFQEHRIAMLEAIKKLVGGVAYAKWAVRSERARTFALVGDGWGDHTDEVHELVKDYLSKAWHTRTSVGVADGTQT